jgi:hypothetical protein
LHEGHLFQSPSGASFLFSVAVLMPALSLLNQLMKVMYQPANKQKNNGEMGLLCCILI